jgi:hypothetical protein
MESHARQGRRDAEAGADYFHDAHGRYPSSLEELLTALHEEQGKDPGIKTLRDPWGRDYLYDAAEGSPVIKCLGSDGKIGGARDAGDTTVRRVPVIWPKRAIE